jgi:hypothetical protein
MKNYIIAFLAISVLVFGTLNYFNADKKRIFKAELSLTKDQVHSLKLDSIKNKIAIFNLETSKQKTDTVYRKVQGETIYVYSDIKPDVVSNTKTLKGSLRNDDLALQWEIKYSGVIYDFIPKWETFTKTITVQNIVKEPYPVEVVRKVPVNARALYLGALINNSLEPYLGVIYADKKRNLFSANYDPINKNWQFGYFYKI